MTPDQSNAPQTPEALDSTSFPVRQPAPPPNAIGESVRPLLVLLLIAVCSCAAHLYVVGEWTESFRRHIPALDNLKQARNTILRGYLYAQLSKNQDATVTAQDAIAMIDQGILEIRDCSDGRSTLSDFDGLPTDDPEVAGLLEDYAKTAGRFRTLLADQLSAPASDASVASLTLRPVLHELTRLADLADRRLHQNFRNQLQRQQRQQQYLFIGWLVFLGALGGLLLLGVRARRRAAEALRRSEEDLSITMQSIGDAVIVTDAAGRVRNMNPVAEQLTGWTLGAAAGVPLSQVFRIINARSRATVDSPVDKVLREGRVVGLANHTALIARDGTERQIADSGAPIRDRACNIVGVVLVFRDVSEQYRLEEELRQAQKLEAIGKLAGGVAHDFNNALTAILGGAQLLRQNIAPTDREIRHVSMIETAAGRAAQLTRQLLAFSRKGRMQSVQIDLNAALRNVALMLEHAVDKRIEIICDPAPGPVNVTGDPAQIENAILNLAVNARDAMPRGGRLRLGTRIADVTPALAHSQRYPVAAGAYVELTVADTGTGIPPDILPHIFEPFFTTKEVGKGTGLGLSAVYGTAQEHNGAVCVSSEPGVGSTFRLLLPLTGTVAEPAPRDAAADAGQGEGILVIEDEPLIRDLTQELLSGLGYRVFLGRDGAEGVAILREHTREIDLILLDMIMPVSGGEDIFPELKRLAPQVPILIASGYGLQGGVQNLLDAGAAGFVRKPYTVAELSLAIGKLLRKPSN